MNPALEFSPRPWGWSAIVAYCQSLRPVFPTPVGMVRGATRDQAHHARFPHARGDGPRGPYPSARIWLFSPRPWGWSEFLIMKWPIVQVFPTPVGMVREAEDIARDADSFPHARGDGPVGVQSSVKADMFSPRPWGWSAGQHER